MTIGESSKVRLETILLKENDQENKRPCAKGSIIFCILKSPRIMTALGRVTVRRVLNPSKNAGLQMT